MAIFETGIGIDVSDHHVRFARVSNSGKPVGLFEITLPHGLIVDDIVKKPKTLQKELRKLAAEAGLSDIKDDAVVLLPESRVFSTSFLIDRKLKGEELIAEAVSLAQKEIPIPFSQSYVDVHKGNRVEDTARVSVLAVEKPVVDGITKAFVPMSFKLEMLEPNNAALHRVYREFAKKEFKLPSDESIVAVVDVGHRWTNITLYGKMNASIFSRSIALRQLSETTKGVVKRLSKPMVERVCKGIKHAVETYQAEGLSIPLVVVGGVEGAQEGVSKYCAKTMKKTLVKRIGDLVEIDELSPQDVHVFGAAIGAGYRAAKTRHFAKDHKILLT